jgi:hypothetical protein
LATPQLSDIGEKYWDTKLHLCCGGIYLAGYTNIDIVGFETPIYSCGFNSTTISNYYARLDGTCEELPKRRITVVDKIADIRKLPYGNSTVHKIVCIQGLEHLNMHDVDIALSGFWRILKTNGVLILSVPDMDATIELLKDQSTRDFAIRHLGGSRRDEFNWHKCWFNKPDVEYLLKMVGFSRVEFLENIHLYPAIVARAIK